MIVCPANEALFFKYSFTSKQSENVRPCGKKERAWFHAHAATGGKGTYQKLVAKEEMSPDTSVLPHA